MDIDATFYKVKSAGNSPGVTSDQRGQTRKKKRDSISDPVPTKKMKLDVELKEDGDAIAGGSSGQVVDEILTVVSVADGEDPGTQKAKPVGLASQEQEICNQEKSASNPDNMDHATIAGNGQVLDETLNAEDVADDEALKTAWVVKMKASYEIRRANERAKMLAANEEMFSTQTTQSKKIEEVTEPISIVSTEGSEQTVESVGVSDNECSGSKICSDDNSISVVEEGSSEGDGDRSSSSSSNLSKSSSIDAPRMVRMVE